MELAKPNNCGFRKFNKFIDLMTWDAAAGRSFLLFAQKKRTKEKGTPCVGLRLPDKNTYLREIEKTRYAQTFRFLILK